MADPHSVTQWLRFVQIVVGAHGNGIDIGDQQDPKTGKIIQQPALRIHFKVDKTLRSAPNTASVLIYNLHPSQEVQCKQEFKDLIVRVGYQGAPRDIFVGAITHAFTYRDENDWITEIQAADGDRDYRGAILNASFGPGKTDADIVAEALESFKELAGTKYKATMRGTITESLNMRGLVRGKVMTGPVRQHLKSIAKAHNANWSIQDGMLDIIEANSVLPDEAVVVNAATGMIGAPEISDKGIQVKCLINPQIRPNGALKLDNNNLRVRSYQQYSNGPKVKPTKLSRLSPDGIYKVYKLAHEGDNFDTDFYTTSECVALRDAIPLKPTATRTSEPEWSGEEFPGD